MQKYYFYLILLGILLTACWQPPSVTSTDTVTPSPVQVTASPTFIPTPSTTPTRTPTPLRSPLPTYTRRPTITISPLDIELATREAVRATDMAILPGCEWPASREYSPDGTWIVILCDNYLTGIYNLDDPTITWELPYGETYGASYENGWIYGILDPIHWSPDGLYLYLTPRPWGMDGGCPPLNLGGYALLRFSLHTGQISITIPPVDDRQFYGFVFSQDGRFLAYWRVGDVPSNLNIRNLITGEEIYVPLDNQYSDIGFIIWSPDFSRIVFSCRTWYECGVEGELFAVVMVNLNDFYLTVLLEDLDDNYHPVEWVGDQIILRHGYPRQYEIFDLSTFELRPYPSPMPTPGQ